MHLPIKAVIFDMDGVLIDSEPLWRRAMIKGFGENGIVITEAQCRQTTGQRLNEVVQLWVHKQQMPAEMTAKIEQDIVRDLIELIDQEGKSMSGANKAIETCENCNLKIGLATSSSVLILEAVLNKLQISHHFDAVLSAQNLKHAKPHPEVFINCAELLGVKPQECLVIEDSVNGIVAAKAAQMQVIAVPDEEHKNLKQFALADYFCNHLEETELIIRKLCK